MVSERGFEALERRLEAFKRALEGALSEKVGPLRVTSKDGVHTVGTKQRIEYPGEEIMFYPGPVGVTTTRRTAEVSKDGVPI